MQEATTELKAEARSLEAQLNHERGLRLQLEERLGMGGGFNGNSKEEMRGVIAGLEAALKESLSKNALRGVQLDGLIQEFGGVVEGMRRSTEDMRTSESRVGTLTEEMTEQNGRLGLLEEGEVAAGRALSEPNPNPNWR